MGSGRHHGVGRKGEANPVTEAEPVEDQVVRAVVAKLEKLGVVGPLWVVIDFRDDELAGAGHDRIDVEEGLCEGRPLFIELHPGPDHPGPGQVDWPGVEPPAALVIRERDADEAGKTKEVAAATALIQEVEGENVLARHQVTDMGGEIMGLELHRGRVPDGTPRDRFPGQW